MNTDRDTKHDNFSKKQNMDMTDVCVCVCVFFLTEWFEKLNNLNNGKTKSKHYEQDKHIY